jgi:hypothetical protein
METVARPYHRTACKTNHPSECTLAPSSRKDGFTYQETAIRFRDHLKAKLGLPVTIVFARIRTLA